MGTTYVWGSEDMTRKQFVENELRHSRNVVDFAVVGSAAYILAGPEGSRGIDVWKLTRHERQHGYKPMDEGMNPYFYDCPKRLIDAADPPANDAAKAWREECARRRAMRARVKSLKDGDRIVFYAALSFGDLGYCSDFVVTHYDHWTGGRVSRRRAFKMHAPGKPEHGTLVRITKLHLREFAIAEA